MAKTPLPDVVKVIPPAWNQLAFFAVQPGESFHDVEEVYHAASKEELEKNGGRIRMAISGWFHIPQIGEDGWVEGAEREAARKSSLMQLQGNPDQHDQPQAKPVAVEKPSESSQESDDSTLDEADFEFLLKYLAPTYLTPDTIERVAEHFEEEFSITLPDILHPKFAEKVRAYVEQQEATKLPESSAKIEKGAWKVARPPHKHRYLYLQPGAEGSKDSPIKELIEVLLPSRQFRVWLQMATHSVIESHDLVILSIIVSPAICGRDADIQLKAWLSFMSGGQSIVLASAKPPSEKIMALNDRAGSHLKPHAELPRSCGHT